MQKGSRIKERKKNGAKFGIIISVDPEYKGIRGKWLVKFDGEEEILPRTTGQLQHCEEDSATRTTQQLQQEDGSETLSQVSDDDWFVAQESNHWEESEETGVQSNSEGTDDQEQENNPDDASIEDIIEKNDDEEEENPYVPNMVDMESNEEHQRKWIEYKEREKKLIEKAHTITIIPSRTTKVKVGDQVKWVSYNICGILFYRFDVLVVHLLSILLFISFS